MSVFKNNTAKSVVNEMCNEEPEFDPEIVKQTFNKTLYTRLAAILGLPIDPPAKRSGSFSTEESVTTFLPEYFTDPVEDELHPESLLSSVTSYYSQEGPVIHEGTDYPSATTLPDVHLATKASVDGDVLSDDFSQYVNQSTLSSKAVSKEVEEKRKAFLKLLRQPVEEAASWRQKEIKTIDNMNEMTLEERGDFLINMIASNFCEWIRGLGGDEPSVIDEDILKELFQVGMDNPASRSIAVQIREKNVLYQKLADLFDLQEASFHNVLMNQLKWDLVTEKKLPRLQAFGSSLPYELRFRPPKNKTKETWFESERLPRGEDNFEDVYRDIADLSSTKEYCKWLINNPQYRRPKYLKSLGMFSSDKFAITHLPADMERWQPIHFVWVLRALYNDSDAADAETIHQIVSQASMLTRDDSDITAHHFATGPESPHLINK